MGVPWGRLQIGFLEVPSRILIFRPATGRRTHRGSNYAENLLTWTLHSWTIHSGLGELNSLAGQMGNAGLRRERGKIGRVTRYDERWEFRPSRAHFLGHLIFSGENHDDPHPRSHPGRQGRQGPRGRFLKETARCVTRKPTITPSQALHAPQGTAITWLTPVPTLGCDAATLRAKGVIEKPYKHCCDRVKKPKAKINEGYAYRYIDRHFSYADLSRVRHHSMGFDALENEGAYSS